jgi:hypothetical protein
MSAVTYATAQFLRVLPRARIGQALGRLADHRWSPPLGRAVVGVYSRVYDVQLDDCVEHGGWSTFDAFFTRRPSRAGCARALAPSIPTRASSPAPPTAASTPWEPSTPRAPSS